MLSKVHVVMKGAISTIPSFDSFFRRLTSVSTFDSKIAINCSKIEKWNAGVKIFLIVFHFVPENKHFNLQIYHSIRSCAPVTLAFWRLEHIKSQSATV